MIRSKKSRRLQGRSDFHAGDIDSAWRGVRSQLQGISKTLGRIAKSKVDFGFLSSFTRLEDFAGVFFCLDLSL